MKYNKTVITFSEDGSFESCFVGYGETIEDKEDNTCVIILSSNAIQCTGKEGTVDYHKHLLVSKSRSWKGKYVRVFDGVEHYASAFGDKSKLPSCTEGERILGSDIVGIVE